MNPLVTGNRSQYLIVHEWPQYMAPREDCSPEGMDLLNLVQAAGNFFVEPSDSVPEPCGHRTKRMGQNEWDKTNGHLEEEMLWTAFDDKTQPTTSTDWPQLARQWVLVASACTSDAEMQSHFCDRTAPLCRRRVRKKTHHSGGWAARQATLTVSWARLCKWVGPTCVSQPRFGSVVVEGHICGLIRPQQSPQGSTRNEESRL